MMDVQCCELQGDEPEYSPEELNEMSQIEEWESEAWVMQNGAEGRAGVREAAHGGLRRG